MSRVSGVESLLSSGFVSVAKPAPRALPERTSSAAHADRVHAVVFTTLLVPLSHRSPVGRPADSLLNAIALQSTYFHVVAEELSITSDRSQHVYDRRFRHHCILTFRTYRHPHPIGP